MRQSFFLLITVIALFSCKGRKGNPFADKIATPADSTLIQWIDSAAAFGTVNEGEKVEVKFTFKNVGDKPLVISEVRPGCGCTTPDYSKEPIAPGGQGWVSGAFDTKGQHIGTVHKVIYVTTNAKNNPQHALIFDGTIKAVETKN